MWLLVRPKDAPLVKNRPSQLHGWFTWQAGFLLCNIEPKELTLPFCPSGHHRALVSHQSPAQEFKYSHLQILPVGHLPTGLWSTCTKPEMLPGEFKLGSLCIMVICRWCLRRHPWKRRGAILLSSKGQGLFWNTTQHLQHSQEHWTS